MIATVANGLSETEGTENACGAVCQSVAESLEAESRDVGWIQKEVKYGVFCILKAWVLV